MNDELRILEITLVNYRQYYGNVEVNFSAESNAFSVLVGANGAGKSNLWNAIHWCLFGKEPHIKSDNAPSIINMKYLYKAEKSVNKSTLAMSVRIVLKSGNRKYLIRRKIEGLLNFLERDDNDMLIMRKDVPLPCGFEIINEDDSTLFQTMDGSGPWKTQSDSHGFNRLVTRYIIPERLSHFFILDGEFLQELFGKFKDIQSGIDQISQIHVLTEAIELVEKTRFPRRITSNQAVEIYEKIKSLEQYLASENPRGIVQKSATEVIYGTDEPMHAFGEPRKVDLQRSIGAMDTRLQELERKKSSSDAVRKTDLKRRYNEKRDEKRRLEGYLRNLIKDHRNLLIAQGPFIMCKPSVMSATKLVQNEMAKGKLPNIPRRMLVGDLLNNELCLCGTPLEAGTSARRLVEDEMGRLTDQAQYDIANDIRYNNERFFEKYGDTIKHIDTEMETIQDARTQLVKLKDEIREMEADLPKEDEDYGDLIGELKRLCADRDEHMGELAVLKAKIESTKQKIGDESRRLDAIRTRIRAERESILLLAKSGIVKDKMNKIKDDVGKTIRDRVSHETLQIFNSLSWKRDYKRLFIDDKYRMRVMDEDGFEIVGGMAAGEKLFLALSFIMALKRVTNYGFPFVIDSPLGKTGGNLRISFGKHMPELLDGSQLIMLATNTEYNDMPIQPEDGGKAQKSLKGLLQEKVSIHEYKIAHNKEEKTSTIVEEISVVK